MTPAPAGPLPRQNVFTPSPAGPQPRQQILYPAPGGAVAPARRSDPAPGGGVAPAAPAYFLLGVEGFVCLFFVFHGSFHANV